MKLGDLSKIKSDRESFKKIFTDVYPTSKPGAILIWAGQMFRFMYEMKMGDIIIYPSKIDKEIHIGRVTGDYDFYPSKVFPHLRSVEWLKSIRRTSFSQGALWEIGSAQSFFQVKNYAEEFLTALKEKTELRRCT